MPFTNIIAKITETYDTNIEFDKISSKLRLLEILNIQSSEVN